MASCRIERKRAHDREAQRTSRAKTKAYIAHLEKTVADLGQSSGDSRANYLAQHASEQQYEIDNLQNLLGKIRTLVQDASKAEQILSPDTALPRCKSEATIDSAGDDRNAADDLFSSTWDSPPSEVDSVEAVQSMKLQHKHAPAKATPKTRTLVVLGVDLSCEDSDDCTYFTRLNEAVTKVEQTPDNLSTQEEDEDILIRAIIHGWDAAEQKHHFDIVWRFLRAFDEGLWYRAAPLERFAHFWQMRSTMLHKIQPSNQPRRRTAPFMAPTKGQCALSTRPAIVDYFRWPQIRNHLLAQGIGHCPNAAAIAFAESFCFVWPYELRDVYKINRSTGLYSLSEGFMSHSEDLSSFHVLQNDLIPYYVHPTLAEAIDPPSFVADCDSSDGSDDGHLPPTPVADSLVIPHIEDLPQDTVDASLISLFSMDLPADIAQFGMDPFPVPHGVNLDHWSGLEGVMA